MRTPYDNRRVHRHLPHARFRGISPQRFWFRGLRRKSGQRVAICGGNPASPTATSSNQSRCYWWPQGPALSERSCTGLPQNGQKRTGCSRMPSLPSFKMDLATVSIRTPFSTKKCRPAGNDIAVVISLQQGSNDFSGSDNCASPALDYSRSRRLRHHGRPAGAG